MALSLLRPWTNYPQNCPATAHRIANNHRRRRLTSPPPTTLVIGSLDTPLSSSLRALRDYIIAGVKRTRTNKYHLPLTPPEGAGALRKEWEAYLEARYADPEYQARRLRERRYEQRAYEEHKRVVKAFLCGVDEGLTYSHTLYDELIIFHRMAALQKESEGALLQQQQQQREKEEPKATLIHLRANTFPHKKLYINGAAIYVSSPSAIEFTTVWR